MAYSTFLAALTLQLWLLGMCAASNVTSQLTCVAGMFTDNNNNNNNVRTILDSDIDPRYESPLYRPAGREPLNQKMEFESHEAPGKMGRNTGKNGAKPLGLVAVNGAEPTTTQQSPSRPIRSDFRNDTVRADEEQLRSAFLAVNGAEPTTTQQSPSRPQRSDFRNDTVRADEEQLRSAFLPCGNYTLDDGEMVVLSAKPDGLFDVFSCQWLFVPKSSGSRLYLKCPVLELPTCDLSSCPANNTLYVTITGQDGTLADIEYRKSIGELKSYGEIAAELDTEVTGSVPQVLCTVWAQSGFDDQGSSSSSDVLCSGGDCGAGIPTSPPSNGGVAQEGDWPSTGLVVAQNYSQCNVLCAVTLISHEYVLTSAACVLRSVASASQTNTYVVLGGHDLSDINDARDEYEIDTQGSLTHPGYTWATLSHDIGLIKLKDSVAFTNRTQPACLPKEGASYGLQDRMFMPGWLEDYNGNRSLTKRSVQQSTWDWLECRDVYGDNMDLTMMCASGNGPCYHNKGGGLLWMGITGALVVVGVASWSPGCGFTDAPAVYSDVAKSMDWITRTMECDGEAWTPQVPDITTPVTCGKANSFEARIVNGTVAEINQYPWQAALVLKKSTSQGWSQVKNHPFCGAAIISSTHLITTASCIRYVPCPHLKMDVLVGYHDILDTSNTPKAAIYGVRDTLIHPDYNYWIIANDIAVILVDTPIIFGKLVAPLCLPVDDSKDYDTVLATTAGWGKTDYYSSTSPTELNTVDVNIISNQECIDYYRFIIFDEEICAYGGGKDSCVGDGGSALIVQTSSGRWEAIGLVAWGIGCAWGGYPGVYTRVTSFLDWVQDNSYGTNLHRI